MMKVLTELQIPLTHNLIVLWHDQIPINLSMVQQPFGLLNPELQTIILVANNEPQSQQPPKSKLKMTEFSESKVSSRGGPLIAVIKIELAVDNTDRIFLHRNDDDMALAEEFARKHGLRKELVKHIYRKIQISREALVQDVQDFSGEKDAMLFQRSLQREKTGSNVNSRFQEGKISQFRSIEEEEFQVSEAKKSPKIQQDTAGNEKYFKEHRAQLKRHSNSLKYSTEEAFIEESSVERNPKSEREKDDNLFGKGLQNHNENKEISASSSIRSPNNQYYGQTGSFQVQTIKQQNYPSFSMKEPQKNSKSMKSGMLEGAQKRNRFFLHGQGLPEEFRELNPQELHSNSDYTFEEGDRPENYRYIPGQNYKFDESNSIDKPSNVRILRKQQIDSLRSSSSNPMRRSLSKTEISRINRNVTNRLYNESDQKRSYLSKIRDKAKQQKDDLQILECTHTPAVNPISDALVRDGRNSGFEKATFERLFDHGKQFQMKRQHCRNLLEREEMNGCSFKPQVNPISQKLAAGRSSVALMGHHPKSPNLGVSNKTIKGHSNQNDFRPKINKISKEIARTKGNFDQRLKSFLEKKNQKLNAKAKEKLIKEKIDVQSGQQLFRPKVTASFTSNSKSNLSVSVSQNQTQNQPKERPQDICQYLYNLSKVPKVRPAEQPTYKINENSQKMVQRMYEKRLAWLFSELDSDNDGIISPEKISIATIGDELLEVIKPVLFEMEEMGAELNLPDFRRAIKNLHPGLNTLEKSVLYNYNFTCKKR